jgi:hypothetical protein
MAHPQAMNAQRSVSTMWAGEAPAFSICPWVGEESAGVSVCIRARCARTKFILDVVPRTPCTRVRRFHRSALSGDLRMFESSTHE